LLQQLFSLLWVPLMPLIRYALPAFTALIALVRGCLCRQLAE